MSAWRLWRGIVVAAAVLAAAGCAARAGEAERPAGEPLCVGGIYPHLAVFNGDYDAATGAWSGTGAECGIGGVVPWAGKLWLITYPPHETRGGRDKLWTIDAALRQEIRPESVGGTHAGRAIHKESNQLIIGPYFVDAQGKVRAADVKNALIGRVTAVARHLADPANLVYIYDMEGAVYEVNVHTLAVTKLFSKPVPGWHGKGAYTGQGRFIVANNGEVGPGGGKAYADLKAGAPARNADERGCLAEWDGKEWRIIERRQFLDVNGPGGLTGEPDPKAPVWTIGWDRRSAILMVLDDGVWHRYRVPKASHTFDPAHGWYTEWPRIREVTGGRWMMDLHGMFFDFPPALRAGRLGGLRPIASHLRYVPDFCDWNGRLVIAADDASVMANPMCGKAQSNLWFGRLEDLPSWGPARGWGGPWQNDEVAAGEPGDAFLVAGFDEVCLHVATAGGVAAASAASTGRMRCTDKYEINSLPDVLAPLPAVMIRRGDFHAPTPGYAFTVNQPVVVYLASDVRGEPNPGEGWQKTDLSLTWGGEYRDNVYMRRFTAGKVEIPARRDVHKDGAYALPGTAFVQGAGEGELKITDLPDALGARIAPGLPPAKAAALAAAKPAEEAAPKAAAPAATQAASFAVEIDRDGSGAWQPYKTIEVPASGYAWDVFPRDLGAAWVRLKPAAAGRATAFFHVASPRKSAAGEDAIFAALARAGNAAPMCAGFVRPAAHNTSLQFLARTVDAAGNVSDAGYWEVDQTLALRRVDEPERAAEVAQVCALTDGQFTVDDASVIMSSKGKLYRLPKGDSAFDKPFATGWPRCIREVQSERFLVNVHGTFYEMPRDTGVADIKPVSTHNRAIADFCSWRGMLVLAGTSAGAKPDGRHFASADGAVGLWFGQVDDLWRLGKPTGRGGPWRETAVQAGQPSDPYLMTNYDRKRLTVSHDATAPVAFTIEVDFDHAGWRPYAVITVEPGKPVTHEFPAGYQAHWVRVRASAACRATAQFVYE